MTEHITNWAVRAAKEWGLFAAFCVFFIGWSYMREGRLEQRFDETNQYVRETLVAALRENTAILQRVANQMPADRRPLGMAAPDPE